MPNASRFDLEQIQRAIQVIVGPAWQRGDVVELRALNTKCATVSGYFDSTSEGALIEAAKRWSGDAHGVYITLNPVLRDCLARTRNRTATYAKNTTGDKEITCRHWLLIDTDPVRPSGISANEQEHALALQRASDIRSALRERGWPDPLYSDSGNGGHLLYRISLPSDDGGLVQRTLKTLQNMFGDATVNVDTCVHNPARISKLYGTLACKGDSQPDRPHRIAQMLEVPTSVEIVRRELLEAIAPASAPTPASPAAPTQANSRRSGSNSRLNVVEYLQGHGVEIGKSKDLGHGTLWELKRCPWRPTESDGGPFVMQFNDGKIAAGCHHANCDGKGWDELRDVIDPNWRNSESTKSKGPSPAQQIVALAAGDELFHTAENQAYAVVQIGNRRETWKIRGQTYRLILRGRLHAKEIIASNSALDDAISTLEAKALFEGPKHSIHVRTAEHGGRLFIDLCNDAWEAVEVTSEGWKVTADPPVRFVRHDGMLPLPTPVEGGDVSQLRDFINVTELDWALVVAWLMAALRPTGPYPILLVNGEQGSCKSTMCRLLRTLIDPNSVALRDSPKNEQTLMIWAKNSHVIALDNLSVVTKDLSNAMCRLATGGGHSERTNYSDDAETLFFAVRPQILNGIGDIATRSDFLDRSLSICLPTVPKSKRRSEKELNEQFAKAQPSIFGALLTAAARGLGALPEVERRDLDLPRLADFSLWMIAVESGLGWEEGTFMRAMSRNEDGSHELALADAPVADAIRKLVERGRYEGGWTDLLTVLGGVVDEVSKRRKEWPTDSRTLSTKVRELAPNLRSLGIEVEFHDNARPKRVKLQSRAAQQSADADPYLSVASVGCYADNREFVPEIAKTALAKMMRVWWAGPVAASVAPVSLPSLSLPLCDGLEAIVG